MCCSVQGWNPRLVSVYYDSISVMLLCNPLVVSLLHALNIFKELQGVNKLWGKGGTAYIKTQHWVYSQIIYSFSNNVLSSKHVSNKCLLCFTSPSFSIGTTQTLIKCQRSVTRTWTPTWQNSHGCTWMSSIPWALSVRFTPMWANTLRRYVIL